MNHETSRKIRFPSITSALCSKPYQKIPFLQQIPQISKRHQSSSMESYDQSVIILIFKLTLKSSRHYGEKTLFSFPFSPLYHSFFSGSWIRGGQISLWAAFPKISKNTDFLGQILTKTVKTHSKYPKIT